MSSLRAQLEQAADRAKERAMTIRTILLSVDLQPEHAHAIDYAYALGEKLGAVVHALHAYKPVVVPSAHGSGCIPYEALHEEARSKLRAAVAKQASSPAMGKCVVDLGEPSMVILDMASALSADLIIVGTHGRQGLKRLLSGSVAEAVLREATQLVLVIGAAAAPLKRPNIHAPAIAPLASSSPVSTS